jgi:hypothetical protein
MQYRLWLSTLIPPNSLEQAFSELVANWHGPSASVRHPGYEKVLLISLKKPLDECPLMMFCCCKILSWVGGVRAILMASHGNNL